MAKNTARFIQKTPLGVDDKLWRSRQDESHFTPTFLDDYALTAQAFIDLYQYTFDER